MQRIERHIEQQADNPPIQVTTFQTTDAPEDVVKFYKDRLSNEGWTVVAQDRPNTLVIADRKACPIYSLDVKANRTDTTSTEVKLRLLPIFCGRY
jgi:hypothetical protein